MTDKIYTCRVQYSDPNYPVSYRKITVDTVEDDKEYYSNKTPQCKDPLWVSQCYIDTEKDIESLSWEWEKVVEIIETANAEDLNSIELVALLEA